MQIDRHVSFCGVWSISVLKKYLRLLNKDFNKITSHLFFFKKQKIKKGDETDNGLD